MVAKKIATLNLRIDPAVKDAVKIAADKELEAQIEAILSDQPRPGTPATFSAEQICHIVAVGCEDPGESGRPITEWTPHELADEVRKRGIVESISPRLGLLTL